MDPKISENFLRLVEDSQANGVPEMHFRFWRRTTDEVRERYPSKFRGDDEAMAWWREVYIGKRP